MTAIKLEDGSLCPGSVLKEVVDTRYPNGDSKYWEPWTFEMGG